MLAGLLNSRHNLNTTIANPVIRYYRLDRTIAQLYLVAVQQVFGSLLLGPLMPRQGAPPGYLIWLALEADLQLFPV